MQLEGSKPSPKIFFACHHIPTAEYQNHRSGACAGLSARERRRSSSKPTVWRRVLGVIVAMTLEEAEAAVKDMLAGNALATQATAS
ncbi:hypothetical protein MJ584_01930 [Klebsiella pneumoniae]|nr:hypothetical protein MJ584_01930 [Klebsiella pneumoniae]